VPQEINFVVNGKPLSLTRAAVLDVMKNVSAEPVQRHSVKVAGVVYPVKQVFEAATGLDRLDFTSAVARRNLAKLGFEVARS
jgi:hypothetical protein